MQKKILTECNFNPRIGEIPLRFEDPVFGSFDESYTVFVFPGFMVT